MNWLIALLTGSAEIGSIAGEADKKPKQDGTGTGNSKRRKRPIRRRDDEESSFVPLDESHGDPFQD